MLNRAYVLLDVKTFSGDDRTFEGIASTPRPDRIGDVIDSLGAVFKLPMPLLLDHDSKRQVGHVEFAKPSKDGIPFKARIATIAEPGAARDLVDTAWQLVKHRLRAAVSIGFRALEGGVEPLKNGGLHFRSWEWLELSLVSIPAQEDAVIFAKGFSDEALATIRSLDTAQRAASGRKPQGVVYLNPPGASGRSNRKPEEGDVKTISEQITALENKRAASATRMEAVMQKGLDEDRTTTPDERDEFDTLQGEVEAIDKDLVRLRQVEKAKAFAASVVKADNAREGAASRGGSIVVKSQPKLAPGIAFAQVTRCLTLAQKMFRDPAIIAADLYGSDSRVVAELKANVPAGSTISGNWAAALVGEETGAVGDFIEFLRPQTILGRFGNGGIPALRSVMFRVPLISQTSGGQGYWTGEGKAKPLTSFDFERTTLEPLKVAAICALTMESIRDSSPKSDVLIRDSLAAALRARLDIDFINPAKTAVAGISPASITNGAETIASAGDDADDVRTDIRSLWAKYTSENNPPSSAVYVMSSNHAVSLAMMTNPLGQPEFGSMTMTGGQLRGIPVIASDYVSDIVVLINTQDVYLADDGDINIDASREASLEMSDAPTHDSITPTAAQLVSMWQTNSVAIRAEVTKNWLRRPNRVGVVYLTSVSWGGEVNTA